MQAHQGVPVALLQKVFVEQNVWIRPFNDLIYVMASYVIEPADLRRLATAIGSGLDAL